MTDLPPGWSRVPLGDACLPVTKHRPEDRPDHEFDYIDISSIDNTRNAISSPKHLVGRNAPSRARQIVRSGDVLLSTVRTYLKNIAMVPPELDGATASTGFCVLRPAPGIEGRYLLHRVLENRWVQRLSERQTGTSYPAVRDADVKEMAIEVPPFTEQSRIVGAIEEHFSRMDAAEDSLSHALSSFHALRSMRFAEAFNGSHTVELGDVAVSFRYGTSVKCSYEASDTPVLRIPNIQHGELNTEDLKYATAAIDREAFGVQEGDLLFVRTNGSRSLIGRVACVGAVVGFAFASYLIRARPDTSRLVPRFAALALSTPNQRRQIEERAATSAGQYNLNLGSLRTLRLPLPPVEEQRRIVDDVDRELSVMQSVIFEAERARRRNRVLRQAVLREAFAGRLIPQDPSGAPPSRLLTEVKP